ncbi:DUF3087 family protein [Oceanospirillum sp.]|uniref:DUF3087 family protein n=1 Tax=Oceanospirillum sp. TaxID=2021254 RepID=UPI003A927C2B
MQIQEVDKQHYLKLSRKVSVVLMVCFAVTAMLSGQFMVVMWGNPEGGNFYLNLSGVIIGVLISGLLFSFYKNDSRLTDLLYVFRLKRILARTTNRMHKLKKGVAADDNDAQRILRFYYEGLMQVYYLESNEYGHSELVKERDVFIEGLSEPLKDEALIDLQPEFIEDVAKRYSD